MTEAPAAAWGQDTAGWDASPPRVSVVVPTVDRPDMLRRALVSIIAQDYAGEIEVIVVFDGTEPVLPALELAARRTLRTASNSRTKGLAGNRNTGYLLAEGELVCACDDDDEWLPGKLTAQVRLMGTSTSASLCATGIVIALDGRETVRAAPETPLQLGDLLRDRHAEIHPSSFMVRRSLLLGALGLVDEEIPGGYAEDYDWMLRAARLGPVVCVPAPFVRVFWHDASFFVSRWATNSLALTYLLDRFPEFESEPVGLSRIEGQLAFASAALGRRREALGLAVRSLRRSPRTRQSYAALLVASRLVSADRVVSWARRLGRGI